MHDAHVLEGGKAYLIVKTLITGSVRGQSLVETLDFMERNVLNNKNRLHLSYFSVIMISEVIIMMVNTNYLLPMTEANQNFSKVVRAVDENGMAVILKNNKPRYVVVDFEEYDTIAAAMQMRKFKIDSLADVLIVENMEALGELAK